MSQLKKLERDPSFKPNEFNKKFMNAEETDTNQEETSEEETSEEEVSQEFNKKISKNDSNEYIDDLGINMKNLFLTILEMMANGINPTNYIMSDSKRQFSFAVMIISIGGLMLFLSNLMA